MDKEKLRDRLLEQKEALVTRLERTHRHIHQRQEPVSPVFSEQSVEMESQQLIYSLDADGREELKKVGEALQRMDDSTYGICTRCGDTITEGRLMAIPHIGLCIDCADDGERNHDQS